MVSVQGVPVKQSSKSIDVGSNAERVNVFDNVGGFSSQVINSWVPNQLRADSDFDLRHQINSNWVIDLPVGRGRKFGSGMGRVAAIAVHESGLVTANAIFATDLNAAERQRIQNEVDGLLQNVQRKYRIVKKKRTSR